MLDVPYVFGSAQYAWPDMSSCVPSPMDAAVTSVEQVYVFDCLPVFAH